MISRALSGGLGFLAAWAAASSAAAALLAAAAEPDVPDPCDDAVASRVMAAKGPAGAPEIV